MLQFFNFYYFAEIIGRENQQGAENENAVLKTLYKLCCLASKAKEEPEIEENGDVVKEPKIADDFLHESTFHRR